MDTRGVHILIDFWGCPTPLLSDTDFLKRAVIQVVKIIKASLLDLHAYQFSAHDRGYQAGISVFAVLKESHISIHTYPEQHFVAIDIYSCGQTDPTLGLGYLTEKLKPNSVTFTKVIRGKN